LTTAEAIWKQIDERWDGSGGPRGIAGTDILLGARIIGLCDVFDSRTVPPRDASNESNVLSEIGDLAGILFDPRVIHAFLRVQPLIQPVGL
jgi:response regulator RpfG family c-di-GMP phosphodiesterase